MSDEVDAMIDLIGELSGASPAEMRELKEKKLIWEFWNHTKRRWDAYLDHVKEVYVDSLPVALKVSSDYFIMLAVKYAVSRGFTREQWVGYADKWWDNYHKQVKMTQQTTDILKKAGIIGNVVKFDKKDLN
jgi:hypothetical protein